MAGSVGVVILGVAGVAALLGWAHQPGPERGGPVTLEWQDRVGPEAAARRLTQAGVIQSPLLFALYFRLVGGARQVPLGQHVLTDALPPAEVVRRLTRRPSRARVKVTIPEGYQLFQIARRLEEHGVCTAPGFVAASRDAGLLRQLEIPARSVEGYLFPATYTLAANQEPDDVVRALVRHGRSRLAALLTRHDDDFRRLQRDLGWGELEVLTLASIIEREARLDEERPIIASVYFNRLTDPEFRPRNRLQADPTAGYGCLVAPDEAPSCAGYDGTITPQMLRDERNRYNTYRHSGLPPGPIANPGEASIRAVLAPAKTNYLYFVATSGGRHTFSRTFGEHRDAIRRGR